MKLFELEPTYEPFFLMLGLEKENKTPHCFDITYADRQVWHIFKIANDEAKKFFKEVLTKKETETFLCGKKIVLKQNKIIPYLKLVMGKARLEKQLHGIEQSVKDIPYYNGDEK